MKGAAKGPIYARTDDLCYLGSALLGPVSSRMRYRRLGGANKIYVVSTRRDLILHIIKLTQKEKEKNINLPSEIPSATSERNSMKSDSLSARARRGQE